VTQTIPSTRAEDRQAPGDVDQSDIIKRRLGSLTAPGANDATVNLPGTASRPTMPIGHSDFAPTAKLAGQGTATGDIGLPGATQPMADPQTVRLSGNGTTSNLDSFMAELTGTALMTNPGSETVPLLPPDAAVTINLSSEIAELRERAEADPGNPDLVFELALALNEAGARSEANQLLQTLVTIYEARGESEQAARIQSMIGDIVTQPFDSNGAQTVVIGRNTTESLGTRNGTMSLKSGQSRDGRVPGRKTDQRERPVFGMREVEFIEPLPQADQLQGDATWFFAKSEKERSRGRYWVALDWIQMTVASDPSVASIYFRMAELQLKTGNRRTSLELIDRIQHASGPFPADVPEWAFARIRLHAEPFELAKVNQLVDQLIADGHGEIAAPYAARLVEHLALAERLPEAQSYSDKIRSLAPGDTRATLEAALLSIRQANHRDAIERWEYAVRNGADATVAKASLAAILGTDNEPEHWRLLTSVMPSGQRRFAVGRQSIGPL
jgi:tetratricopeptide (TPR) repeat protein